MLHKAWNSKEEMPYCFPRSSIKFQGHTGQNITDFDPNWAFRTTGRSQLSNPSDLPCFTWYIKNQSQLQLETLQQLSFYWHPILFKYVRACALCYNVLLRDRYVVYREASLSSSSCREPALCGQLSQDLFKENQKSGWIFSASLLKIIFGDL